MRTISTRERLRYAFDNTLSHGPMGLVVWLGALTGALIVVASIAVYVARIAPPVDDKPAPLGYLAWLSFIHALDPAAVGGDSGPWFFVAVMLVVSLGGLFVASALIGVITSALESRLEELRKGRSRVAERGHTVVLGWSEQILPIVAELVEANASQARACVVILGDHDKVEMEDTVRTMLGSTGTTRIVCRSGSPMDMDDLEITNLDDARAVVLSLDGEEDPDFAVIKTLLAITNRRGRRTEPYHIVAALRDPRNAHIARIVGRDEVEIVLMGDVIARITAQTTRQSGLSVVYSDLLDFAGDEIYFHREPSLAGRTFGEALHAFSDAALIGLGSDSRVPRLNPPMDTVIGAGDALVVIAADENRINLASDDADLVDATAIHGEAPAPPRPEKTVVLGWNWRGPLVLRALDSYVARGSTVTVVADDAACATAIAELGDLANLTVTHEPGDATHRGTLEEMAARHFEHAIVLSCSDRMGAQQADQRTLMTLLHLRDIAEQTGQPLPVVSEMLDPRNQRLVAAERADDFIVSDRIVSQLMAQVAENKALNAVFADLFDPEGSEIYLKPVTQYVRTGVPVTYATVVEAARRRGEVGIGYRIAANAADPAQAYGVALNPRKITVVTFAPDDKVIVLADN